MAAGGAAVITLDLYAHDPYALGSCPPSPSPPLAFPLHAQSYTLTFVVANPTQHHTLRQPSPHSAAHPAR